MYRKKSQNLKMDFIAKFPHLQHMVLGGAIQGNGCTCTLSLPSLSFIAGTQNGTVSHTSRAIAEAVCLTGGLVLDGSTTKTWKPCSATIIMVARRTVSFITPALVGMRWWKPAS